MKAFVIYLPKIESSAHTARQMIEPLTNMGFDVTLFEGTYGDEAVNLAVAEGRTLHPIDQEGNPTPDTIRTRGAGALGCFYSHYRLWQQCVELNEPIWIFEDDVKFIRPYHPVPFDEVLITVLGSWKRMYERDVHQEPDCEPHAQEFPSACVPGTPGYAITPQAAKKLLTEFAHTFTASDCAIRRTVVNIKIHSHIVGAALTDQDGKKSLTNSLYWDTLPRAYVIHLPEVESSATTAQRVLEQLKEFRFRAELFAGIDGRTAKQLWIQENRRMADLGLKPETLTVEQYKKRFPGQAPVPDVIEITVRKKFADDIRYQKAQKPGVKGCFYSHYRLWQKCVELNEPIFVFEDDVIFERGYIPVDWQDVLMVCAGKKSYQHEFYGPLLYAPQGRPEALDIPNLSLPGAVGYGIKPHAAKILVDRYRQEMLPADTAINCYVLRLQTHNYLMGRAAIDVDGKVSLTDPESPA
jgi:GR25 family glycosyltransferase involved in LPS biosynthesis